MPLHTKWPVHEPFNAIGAQCQSQSGARCCALGCLIELVGPLNGAGEFDLTAPVPSDYDCNREDFNHD